MARKATPAVPAIDFIVEGGGSLFLLRPLSDAGRSWVEENIGQENGYQPYWPTVAIESRYLEPIIHGIAAEGLQMR